MRASEITPKGINKDEFILYLNNNPVARYQRQADALSDLFRLNQQNPQAKIEIKARVCKLQTVKAVNETFQKIDELTFKGSPCTKDCSGHRAGYEWSRNRGGQYAMSWSPSFNTGAALFKNGY